MTPVTPSAIALDSPLGAGVNVDVVVSPELDCEAGFAVDFELVDLELVDFELVDLAVLLCADDLCADDFVLVLDDELEELVVAVLPELVDVAVVPTGCVGPPTAASAEAAGTETTGVRASRIVARLMLFRTVSSFMRVFSRVWCRGLRWALTLGNRS
jgi:hypothetical protein